jgi:predicted N-acyltransferase
MTTIASNIARDTDALGSLSAGAWDRLAGEHFYSSSRWLRFCAAHAGADQGAVVVSGKDGATVAVPVARLTEPPGALYRWNHRLAALGLPELPSDGLLVGPRQGYQTHLLTAGKTDPTADLATLVSRLRERSHDGAQRDDAACVAMFVTTDDVRALQAAGVSAPPVLLEADAWIDLPPGGWEGWLESLPAKRRSNIRRETRRFDQAGYQVTHAALADCYTELPDLAGATQHKYGASGTAQEWLDLLRTHVDVMGSAARVAVCARPGHRPVGFCVYYVWNGTVFLRWAGFDYERLSGVGEYFNVTYYSQVKAAQGLGATRIHAGVKASEAKALRGADLRPLWMVDLSEDSALERHLEAVHRHNVRGYELLADNATTRLGLSDPDAWRATR